MRFFFIALFILFVSAACSNQKGKKIKNLEAIRSKSTYQPKKDSVIVENKLDTLLSIYNQDSVQMDMTSIELDTNESFLDQFTFKNSLRVYLTDSKDRKTHHQYWKYKTDSTLVKNNFFNWFDREYVKGDSTIRIYSHTKLGPGNVLFFCTNKSIHIIKSTSKIDPEKWLRLIQLTEKKVRFLYVCHQAKNKEANWYTVNKKKLTLIPEE